MMKTSSMQITRMTYKLSFYLWLYHKFYNILNMVLPCLTIIMPDICILKNIVKIIDIITLKLSQFSSINVKF